MSLQPAPDGSQVISWGRASQRQLNIFFCFAVCHPTTSWLPSCCAALACSCSIRLVFIPLSPKYGNPLQSSHDFAGVCFQKASAEKGAAEPSPEYPSQLVEFNVTAMVVPLVTASLLPHKE